MAAAPTPSRATARANAELERALSGPDPLRGIAQLTARLAGPCVLDLAGVTRTKALATERMARMLGDALPGGDADMHAVWQFMRPMLSPALVALNRDTFVVEDETASTVDLDARRAATSLDELDLGEPDSEAA